MLNNGFTPFKNIKIALKAFKELKKFSPNSTLCLFGNQMEEGAACHEWAKKNNYQFYVEEPKIKRITQKNEHIFMFKLNIK